jgi:hypothetical protein
MYSVFLIFYFVSIETVFKYNIFVVKPFQEISRKSKISCSCLKFGGEILKYSTAFMKPLRISFNSRKFSDNSQKYWLNYFPVKSVCNTWCFVLKVAFFYLHPSVTMATEPHSYKGCLQKSIKQWNIKITSGHHFFYSHIHGTQFHIYIDNHYSSQTTWTKYEKETNLKKKMIA